MGIPDLTGMQWLAAVLMFLMFTSGSLTFMIRMMVTMQLNHDKEQRQLDRQSFEQRVTGVMQHHRNSTQEMVRILHPIQTTTQDTNKRVKGIEDTLSREGVIFNELASLRSKIDSMMRFIEQIDKGKV